MGLWSLVRVTGRRVGPESPNRRVESRHTYGRRGWVEAADHRFALSLPVALWSLLPVALWSLFPHLPVGCPWVAPGLPHFAPRTRAGVGLTDRRIGDFGAFVYASYMRVAYCMVCSICVCEQVLLTSCLGSMTSRAGLPPLRGACLCARPVVCQSQADVSSFQLKPTDK